MCSIVIQIFSVTFGIGIKNPVYDNWNYIDSCLSVNLILKEVQKPQLYTYKENKTYSFVGPVGFTIQLDY